MAEPVFTDRALQETYRALIAESAPGDHLDEATWDALAGSDADAARRDAAFDHVVACDRCSRIWRGVLALREEAQTQGLIARQPPRAALWRSPLVQLAAAASLVIVAGGIYLSQPRSTGTDVTRSTAAAPVVDALMVAYAPDGVPTFVWAPVPGASRYRIELFTDDGRPVWSREAGRPPLRWPADVPRATGSYRWRVEALNGDTVLARSPITTAELAR